MNILIVDDEEKVTQYLSKGLKESGYTIKTANTGMEGKWLAQTQDFDLIILDVMLPATKGEACS